jgi:hypothetical protein
MTGRTEFWPNSIYTSGNNQQPVSSRRLPENQVLMRREQTRRAAVVIANINLASLIRTGLTAAAEMRIAVWGYCRAPDWGRSCSRSRRYSDQSHDKILALFCVIGWFLYTSLHVGFARHNFGFITTWNPLHLWLRYEKAKMNFEHVLMLQR